MSRARDPKCGMSKLAVRAELSESGVDEIRDGGRARVVGVVHLRVVAEGADEVSQPEAPLAHDLVRAVVGVLRRHADGRLRRVVVLLPREADGVVELYPALLALVRVAPVVAGETHLAESELFRALARMVSVTSTVLIRLASRLDVCRLPRFRDEGLDGVLMGLAEVEELVGVDRPRPVAVGPLLHVPLLQRLLSGVEGNVGLAHRVTGHGHEVFGDGNLDIGVSGTRPRTADDVADRLGHGCYAPPVCSRYALR